MQLVPVLEIRHGKCVHTEPKNAYVDQVVRANADEIVAKWVEFGVSRIHIVDVDAIESGEPENVDLVAKIKKLFPSLEIQILGGIRCVESAYVWIDAGVDYLVLTGRALRQKGLLDDLCVEFPNRVMVELDSRKGLVSMGTGRPDFELTKIAHQLEEDGVVGLVVTEVPESGRVGNHELHSIKDLSADLEMPIFANGGIEKMADLKSILDSQAGNLSGILVGKPLYNGFCLEEARALIASYQN